MDFDVVRFAVGMAAGLFVGVVLGWTVGGWAFNDPSVGLGFGAVLGAGIGAISGTFLARLALLHSPPRRAQRTRRKHSDAP